MAKTLPEQSTRRSSLGNEQLAIETGSSLGIAGGQIEPAEVTGNARCGWGPLDPSLATLRCSWPAEPLTRPVLGSTAMGGRWIKGAMRLRDVVDREATEPGMVTYGLLAVSQVAALGLVIGDEGLHPLHLATRLRQCLVGGGDRALQLLAHQGRPTSGMSRSMMKRFIAVSSVVVLQGQR